MLNGKLFLSTAIALSLLSCDYSHAGLKDWFNKAKNKVSSVASQEIEVEVLKKMDKKYGANLTKIMKNQKEISSAKKEFGEAKDEQSRQIAAEELLKAANTEFERAKKEYEEIKTMVGNSKQLVDSMDNSDKTELTGAQ